jgi:thioredoxin 1
MDTQVKRKSFEELISESRLVLVDFSAAWCGPCKMMTPILQEVKSSMGSEIRIIKIDVDKNSRLATTYQITGVPTLILFRDGKQVWRKSGVLHTNALLEAIKSV